MRTNTVHFITFENLMCVASSEAATLSVRGWAGLRTLGIVSWPEMNARLNILSNFLACRPKALLLAANLSSYSRPHIRKLWHSHLAVKPSSGKFSKKFVFSVVLHRKKCNLVAEGALSFKNFTTTSLLNEPICLKSCYAVPKNEVHS